MEAQTKNCQNCKMDFEITSDDFGFYEKIKVPPPTWCPECRMERRMSFVNTWNLYWRNCDKCAKKTMSIYPPEQKITVFCCPCFWSDSWDGTEYAVEYDPNRPFLEQVQELSEKVPFVALDVLYKSLKNSDYSNGIAWSKNCYQTFWADFCDNVYYSSILNGLKSSSDCLRGWKSELCYESTGFIGSYRVFFSEDFDDCVDTWFSRNCYGCMKCIGCVNLRGASYQIFNVQYSKEEYAKKLKEFGLDSWENIHKLEKQAREFWLTKPYREFHGNAFNLNVTGEHVYRSKNSKECYILNGAESCKYCQLITVDGSRDCMDYSGWGNNADLIYEGATVGENSSSVKFAYEIFQDCMNLEYSFWCTSAKNDFGCISLKRKNYCILNKEYPKEEHEKLRAHIIEEMKKNPYIDALGRKYLYGEFFPLEMSKFPYNKSNAMRFMPKTKEQALREGYDWSDREESAYKPTVSADSLPERITDTEDNILNEVIECSSCRRSYKIVQGELELLRKMGLPVPRECPKCRENKRFARMNKPGMYHRKCDKCGVDIYTPYKPEDPRIVYCVKDYQALFA